MAEKADYLKKINNASVVQQVIDSLTSAMINKQLRPGDKIPTELELAESLGVGRLSIREAIKVLVYYGVLEIRRPEGTFVCEGFRESMIDPMLYGIILDTDDSYSSLKELRQMMEVGVVKLAVAKATEEDYKRLDERYKHFEAVLQENPIQIEKVFEADNMFHQVVTEMGRNPLVEKINALVRTLTHDLRFRTVANMIAMEEGETLLAAHKAICDIIFQKDFTNIDCILDHGYFYDRINL